MAEPIAAPATITGNGNLKSRAVTATARPASR